MNTFLKYLGAFCLLSIAASLAFCSIGVYNGMQTFNKLFAGADNYTCRQFLYDLSEPQADKSPAIVIAVALYGTGAGQADDATLAANQTSLRQQGAQAAVAQVTSLCRGKPDERLLNLFAQSLVSPTAAGVSSSTVSVTTPASPTLNTKN